MNREQMIAWLTLEGYYPINGPWATPGGSEPGFHNAVKGNVNISVVVSEDMLKYNSQKLRVSMAHSWTEDHAGSWDVIHDHDLTLLYEKAVSLCE